MSDPCVRCGAARRSDGLGFCPNCGALYPVVSTPLPADRAPRIFSHPWLMFITAGAIVGVALALVARERRAFVGSWTSNEPLAVIVFWVAAWGLFWLPTIIAVIRRRVRIWTVALVNLFLAPSVIGWVFALWLATGGQTHEPPAAASRNA